MTGFASVTPRTTLATRDLPPAGLRERFGLLRKAYLGHVLGLSGTSAALSPKEGQARRLERVSVHPVWRGRGLARGLLAQLEAEAHARGARRLVLITRAGWPSATTLSRSEGFMPTHQGGDAYTHGSGYTALHFQKVRQ